MVYTGDSFGRAAGCRFILDTGAADDDSDEFYSGREGEDDEYDDGDSVFSVGGAGIRSPPLLKPSRVVNGRRRPRSSGFYGRGWYEEGVTGNVIEEEREGKVDVRDAVRLRKEVKARARKRGGRAKGEGELDLKRVGQVGVRVREVVGLGVGVGGEEEEEGNRADVE